MACDWQSSVYLALPEPSWVPRAPSFFRFCRLKAHKPPVAHSRGGLSRSGLPQHHPTANHLGLGLPFVFANFLSPLWLPWRLDNLINLPNPPIAAVARSHMSTSTSVSIFPFVIPLLLGDFFGVGLEVPACPPGTLCTFCGRAYGIALSHSRPSTHHVHAGTRKSSTRISNSPRLLSLTRWCFPPLGLVMTIRFPIVGHKPQEVGIFMMFPSHVFPAGRHLSILGPQTSISCFLYFSAIPILPAVVIPMTVTVDAVLLHPCTVW